MHSITRRVCAEFRDSGMNQLWVNHSVGSFAPDNMLDSLYHKWYVHFFVNSKHNFWFYFVLFV